MTQRTVDIWIIENNTIYRDVPFTVVTDWVQQGRLLPDDKVRAAGTETWRLLGAVSAFKAYFPRPEPQAAEDPAEALEPVESVIATTKHKGDEDEDVDMIPLIDISLVLLIFFMMTAAISTGVVSPVATPEARYQLATITDDMFWLKMEISKNLQGEIRRNNLGQPIAVYSAGKAKETFAVSGAAKSIDPTIKVLEKEMGGLRGKVKIRIRANKMLREQTVTDAMIELQKMAARLNESRPDARSKIAVSLSGEVTEPEKK